MSSTPARMTEPGVGAWVWASGSQVCTGKSGTLMAKLATNAQKHRAWACGGSTTCEIASRSKVHTPPEACQWATAR
ncbi:MAG: hypothetical protein KDK70_10040 [Myxococcales bacterium]|nr:hypothetical protein [Myxococcales bacterium]